mgnify:CR=1 FL=1
MIIEKSTTQRINIEAKEFNGKKYIDIREYYIESLDDPIWKPSKKGVTIPIDKVGELKEIVARL